MSLSPAGLFSISRAEAFARAHEFDEPLADKAVLAYVGPASPEKHSEIYGKALALIHLSDVHEPFRLSFVEAMACGTPVIARRGGANAEIVEHGKTGFLVQNHEDLIEAISKIRLLDRRKVRQRMIDHFSQNGMVTQYLRIYEMAISRAEEQIRREEEEMFQRSAI